MPSVAEKLNSGMGLVISTGTIIAMGASVLFWMDSRHASAGDIDRLTEAIKQSELSRLEYRIEETERRGRRILRIPENERTQFDNDELVDLELKREFLLRELKRIEEAE